MKPVIDHIHITVENIERAELFYDQLLPILGFDISLKEHDCVPEHEYKIVEYHHRNLSIRTFPGRNYRRTTYWDPYLQE